MSDIKKREKFLNGPIIPALLTITLPILVGNFLQSAYQFIDAYWIGKLGETAVASISVTFPLIFFLVSLGIGFSFAGNSLVAQYYGSGNKKMLNYTTAQVILIMVFLSLFLGIGGYFFVPELLGLFGVEGEVFEYALPFLQVTLLGLIGSFMYNIFSGVLRGIGEVKIPMYVVGLTVVLNLFLDPLFIFGYGFVPAYGVAGAAISTVICQVISCAILLYFMLRGKCGISLHCNDFIPDFRFMKRIFDLGWPSGLEMSSRSFSLVLMVGLVTGFGTQYLAAYGAGGNILNFIIIPCLGIAIATATLVGQNLGAEKIERVEKIVKLSALVGFVGVGILGVLGFVFAPQLMSLFIHGAPEVIGIGAGFIRVISLFFGLLAMEIIFTAVLRVAGNVKIALTGAILSQFVFQLPFAYFMGKYTSLGVNAIWWSFPVSYVGLAIFCGVIYWRGKWKETQLIEK